MLLWQVSIQGQEQMPIEWRSVRCILLVLILTSMSQAQLNDPATSPIVDANSRFAFKLFKQLTNDNPQHNIVVAPTGLSLTFGLLDNGSDPETRREIESAFEFTGMDVLQINDGFAALRKEMDLVPPPPQKKGVKGGSPAPLASDPNRLVIADSLWGHKYFSAAFRTTSRNYYGLDLERLLPTSSPSAQVSRWASKKAHTNIPILMGTIAQGNFLLVDVTRFHSRWSCEFDVSMTKPAPFTLLTGLKKNVPMMHQERKFDYLEGVKFQAVVLPYRQGSSMYVFLPSTESSLKELEQTLSARNWQEWVSQFRSREGMLGLPKFKIGTSFDAGAALQELGVRRIFEELAALRPVIGIEGARLTEARQVTDVSVDEKETEAISVTMVGGVVGGIGAEPPKPFEMIVDRPFFFAIRHNSTGQLLFLGAVVEP